MRPQRRMNFILKRYAKKWLMETCTAVDLVEPCSGSRLVSGGKSSHLRGTAAPRAIASNGRRGGARISDHAAHRAERPERPRSIAGHSSFDAHFEQRARVALPGRATMSGFARHARGRRGSLELPRRKVDVRGSSVNRSLARRRGSRGLAFLRSSGRVATGSFFSDALRTLPCSSTSAAAACRCPYCHLRLGIVVADGGAQAGRRG